MGQIADSDVLAFLTMWLGAAAINHSHLDLDTRESKTLCVRHEGGRIEVMDRNGIDNNMDGPWVIAGVSVVYGVADVRWMSLSQP